MLSCSLFSCSLLILAGDFPVPYIFTSDIFENIEISENSQTSFDEIYISAYQSQLIDTKATNRLIYDNITFTIEVPYEVIENNADSVKGN
ncbi:MAG: hypothetical protein IKX76_02320, partial [Eubacterium sp.]|nr:hypothetical protein [Eubacterium sp.]